MAQQPMYAAVVNSPLTELAANVTANATSITVVNAAMLPLAPNLLTIGSDDTAETVRYTAISGNVLTVVRGFQGSAKEWNAGAKVARYYTAYDHNTFVSNISDVVTQLGAKETPAGAQAKVDDALLTARADATVKANQAEVNAKNASIPKTTTNILNGNINNHRVTGFYAGSGVANAPSADWYYYEVIAHVDGNPNWCTQTAYDFYSYATYRRNLQEGVWSPWIRMLNANDYNTLFQYASDGKNVIANAITGKGVPASRDETHQQLADKITQITTGKRTARVDVTFNSADINKTVTASVPNIGFTPSYAVIERLYISTVNGSSGGGVGDRSVLVVSTQGSAKIQQQYQSIDVSLALGTNNLILNSSVRIGMGSPTLTVFFVE